MEELQQLNKKVEESPASLQSPDVPDSYFMTSFCLQKTASEDLIFGNYDDVDD